VSQPKSVAIRLLPIIDFLKPYYLRIFLALLALIFTAGVMLSIGQGLKYVVTQALPPGLWISLAIL